MYNVALYSFSQKINSTLRPDSSYTPIIAEGTLKEVSSLINPTISFYFQDDYAPSSLNYAYIEKYGRYYFIQDWTWESGFWIARMQVDVLASFRSAIGNEVEYVVRSSAESDGSIMDYYYPTTATVTKYANQSFTGWEYDLEEGSYVVGVIGSGGGDVGAVSYYRMNQAGFNMFMTRLMSTNLEYMDLPDEIRTVVSGDYNLELLQDYSKEILKAQFNPIQYVTSCMWFPFDVSISGAVSRIPVGYWDIAAPAAPISTNLEFNSFTIPIPKHPQASTRGEYLNLAPFSRYILLAGNFGQYPLDSTLLAGQTSIDVDLIVDPVTGIGSLYASIPVGGIGHRLIQAETKIGVDIQIAQITQNWLGAGMGAVGGITGMITGALSGNLTGAIQSAFSGIGSTIDSLIPQLATTGTNGSRNSLRLPYALQSQHLNVVDEDNAHRGRPLCKRKVLGDIPGYIQCADVDIKILCTQEEQLRIKSLLEEGFFYE